MEGSEGHSLDHGLVGDSLHEDVDEDNQASLVCMLLEHHNVGLESHMMLELDQTQLLNYHALVHDKQELVHGRQVLDEEQDDKLYECQKFPRVMLHVLA